MGHLLYAISSCVHHFVAIYEFKLELRSGNTQTGAKFVDDTMKETLWEGVAYRQTDRRMDGRKEVFLESCLVAAKKNIVM